MTREELNREKEKLVGEIKSTMKELEWDLQNTIYELSEFDSIESELQNNVETLHRIAYELESYHQTLIDLKEYENDLNCVEESEEDE